MGLLLSAARDVHKHSTLALCFQPVGTPKVSVNIAPCASLGTEALPLLRHRLVLFAFVTTSTLGLPTSLLVRSYLAHSSLGVARACGTPAVRAEEVALTLLALGVVCYLSLRSSRHEARQTLAVAAHTWYSTQVLEGVFLFVMHCACGCCPCLGLWRKPQAEESARLACGDDSAKPDGVAAHNAMATRR
jgi:hypothetical protein